MLFGALFALNSYLHSHLVVSYAKEEGVSLYASSAASVS